MSRCATPFCFLAFFLAALVSVIFAQIIPINNDQEVQLKCPQYWVQFRSSCYRFIKSPIRPRTDAQKNCQAYDAELVNINSLDEHNFIVFQLSWQDPQHRRWYTAARQQSPGYWVNEGDGSTYAELSSAFLQETNEPEHFEFENRKDFLAYSFMNKWGLQKVSGDEHLLYICEAPVTKLSYLVAEERSFLYGLDVDENVEKIPRGPFFIKQPVNVVYDLNNQIIPDVTMACLAGGYPSPTYEWFKEDYKNDTLSARKIDTLLEPRYTASGGSLIINHPNQTADGGSYHCKATNKYGTIISESIKLSFGFVREFNLNRAPESGSQNWGKTIFCDPPQHFPGVKYHWSRNIFPNLVEEDNRVFVSFDGSLYFSALEQIDRGNYSCTVQNEVSNTGRNGPYFTLNVNPSSNYQQLQFPVNFPKAFPEAPIAGKDVRLECVAFGYPVPSYNWTRKYNNLPRNSYTTNFNRVLVIPNVRIEDQGEYVCRANNDNNFIFGSVVLSIQAEPNFTIPLMDRHMDIHSDLTWTCEAFGIPDVSYKWLKNGELMHMDRMPKEDSERYIIQDNILTIKYLNPDRDPGMYQCRANNTLRSKYSSAQLRVLSLKPSFKRHPIDREIYAGEGGRVTILCRPEASPKPKYIWRKDGNVIGSGGPRYIVDGNLTISPVSRSDYGNYTCKAENMFGAGESSGKLTVLRAPVFLEALTPRIDTIASQNLELRCSAFSADALDMAYAWYHNGLRLTSMQTPYNAIIVNGGALNMYNISFSSAGEYECVVKSVVGDMSSKTVLSVIGPPSPPGGIQVTFDEAKKKSVTLRWTDGSSNGRPILHYIISGRTNWNKNWFNNSQPANYAKRVGFYTERKEITLENILSPWCVYEFRIFAVNELGVSMPSELSPQYRTQPDRPYIAPSHVSGGGGKVGDLTITWTPLAPQDQNADDTHYIVYWRRSHFEKQFQKHVLKNLTKNGIVTETIPNQYYYTEYDVKVQAVNSIGAGPDSEIVTIYSAEDIPQYQPEGVSARSFNSTALHVSWNPIKTERELIRGKLIGHRLKYWKQDTDEDNAVYYLSRSPNSTALIVGLQPDTYYFVKVMIFNGAGAGPESERYLERTYRKPPQNPPTSVFVKGLNPSMIKVVWRYVSPKTDEEPLIGYKVRVWPMDQHMSTATDTYVYVGAPLEAYVINLSPGKKYNLRVLAFSNGGDGQMSAPTIHFQMGREELFRNEGTSEHSTFSIVFAIMFAVVHKFI